MTRPRPGERVLDACCGTGASAIPAARAVGPDGIVDSVDSSDRMIEVLRRSAVGLPQLHAATGDVLAWEQGGYDVVQAALGIFFLPDMQAGTEQLIARARPGGRVGFTIWRAGAMEGVGRVLARAVAAVTGTELPPRPHHLIQDVNRPEPYGEWLRELGLRQVAVTVDERSVPTDDEPAWLVVTGSGYRSMIAALGDDQVAEVRRRYLAGLPDVIDATTLIGTGVRAADRDRPSPSSG